MVVMMMTMMRGRVSNSIPRVKTKHDRKQENETQFWLCVRAVCNQTSSVNLLPLLPSKLDIMCPDSGVSLYP
jgi:hypothetical protein